MILAALLFLAGLAMSAFFSGAETGLYRVSRTRLVLDGLAGSRSARALIWLLNRPAIFVATTLVGNNVANFITSFSLVAAVGVMFGDSSAAELFGTVLMTPIVFVFGELLPKHLFYQAPYRLLNHAKPLLFFATLLFLPISSLLGLLGNVLRWLTGQTPFRLRLAMTRGELEKVLRAGQEAGLLQPGQRSLAQQLFEVGNVSAASFGVRPDRLPNVDFEGESVQRDLETAMREARRQNHPIVLVRRKNQFVGYLRYSELVYLESTPQLEQGEAFPIRPLIRGTTQERHLSLLLRMYDANSEVALLGDAAGNTKFCVTRRQLLQPLIKAQ